uniref:Threonylcarbamoyl-AMP synthase n=1 Tax=Geoglobus ahangari TaxID=113653 RepID=A0A7C4WBX5_9EURY
MLIIRVNKDNPETEKIKKAAEIIKKGGLVAFPTETVYGLGADALNARAVKRIFEVKGRPPDNPLIVHVSSVDDVYKIAKPNKIAKKLMEEFFPGPLTLVMEKKDIVPDITTANLKTIAVRMPDHKVALKLIELSETPIAAPSANKSGKPSPTRAEHVIEDFKDEIECVIDGGEVDIGLESTVVDTTTYPIEILRPGAITKEMLEEFFDVKVAGESDVAKSPGMKYRHYAPEAETIVIKDRKKILELAKKLSKNGKIVGIAAMNPKEFKDFITFDLGRNYEEFAKNLFKALRELDKKCNVIIVEGIEEKGIGLAIMNRLKKAGKLYDLSQSITDNKR